MVALRCMEGVKRYPCIQAIRNINQTFPSITTIKWNQLKKNRNEEEKGKEI